MDGVLSIGSETLNLASEFAKTATENDREARFPTANFDRLREAGLLSLTAAREDGGEDASLTSAVKLVGDIAQGCPSTALVLAMQLI